jgi:hypothetical protein
VVPVPLKAEKKKSGTAIMQFHCQDDSSPFISHFKDRHEEISDIHPVRALNFGENEPL